ncbi:MAG: thiamine phosphate synthase [Magnetococcus sp. YQC-5]
MILSPITGLYPILDAQCLEPLAGVSPTTIAQHMATLPISVVQLRCKGNGRQACEFMTRWMNALRRHCPKVKVILNDRLELALALDADGVHVGQEDLPIALCRRLLGPDRILGLSTHSLTEIRAAEAMQVHYVGFGPVFDTSTKSDTQPVQGLDALATVVQATHLPIVAIGGITQARIPSVLATGAAAVAMISDLWQDDWSRRLTVACSSWQQAKVKDKTLGDESPKPPLFFNQ